jgi:hypothetical protein
VAGTIRTQKRFAHSESPLEQRLRLRVAPLDAQGEGEIVEALGNLRMLWAKALLGAFQRPLRKGRSFRVLERFDEIDRAAIEILDLLVRLCRRRVGDQQHDHQGQDVTH